MKLREQELQDKLNKKKYYNQQLVDQIKNEKESKLRKSGDLSPAEYALNRDKFQGIEQFSELKINGGNKKL